MRTSISLEDRLGEQVKERARAQGMSVSAFISLVLDDHLKRGDPSPDRPFQLVTVGGPGVADGIDLDRPRLLDVAEDERHYG